MSRRVPLHKQVRNFNKAPARKRVLSKTGNIVSKAEAELALAVAKAGNPAGNWKNLRRRDGTFKVSKRGKYNQQGRFINGTWFASKAEGDRYEQLLELQSQGEIGELECQPAWKCVVNGKLICTHRADFRYRIAPRKFGSRVLVEEIKGMRTKDYLLKMKLMAALHPDVVITELMVGKRGNVQRWRYLTGDRVKEIIDEHATQHVAAGAAGRTRAAGQPAGETAGAADGDAAPLDADDRGLAAPPRD